MTARSCKHHLQVQEIEPLPERGHGWVRLHSACEKCGKRVTHETNE